MRSTTARAARVSGARALPRPLELIAFGALPVVFLVSLLSSDWDAGNLAFDFVHFELPAADRLVHGESPYPGFGYPPLVAFALVPFVAVPAADVIVTTLLVLSVPAILWLLAGPGLAVLRPGVPLGAGVPPGSRPRT